MKAMKLMGIVLFAAVSSACGGMPTSRVTVIALDEAGLPVSNAVVKTVFLWADEMPPNRIDHDGLTDSNGVFVTQGPSALLSVNISKHGYYAWRNKTRCLGYRAYKGQKLIDVVENPVVTSVLKRIVNPVPLIARAYRNAVLHFPATNSPIGFDMVVGDWAPPWGKGQIADIYFTGTGYDHGYKNGNYHYNSLFTISFPNEGDGIQASPYTPLDEYGSVLRMRPDAPDTGYRTNFVFRYIRDAGQMIEDTDMRRCFFFRIRTVMKDGKVESALYGKTAGDINGFISGITIIYYLNPTPNDRSLEWNFQNLADPKSPGVTATIPGP